MSLPVSLLKKIPGLTWAAKSLYAAGGNRLHNIVPFSLPRRLDSGRHIFIDVSSISRLDHKTGIQRLTRSLYRELARAEGHDARIVPVYATMSRKGYFRAIPNPAARGTPFIRLEEPTGVNAGDIFLALDFAPLAILAQSATLKAMKKRGAQLYFIVNDLLPVLHPEWFPAGTRGIHAAWLKEICQLGEPICVSRAVASELLLWLSANGLTASNAHWIHLGADSIAFQGSSGNSLLLPKQPYFLVVSTIEPRKGHCQALEAFEILWQAGHEIGLVFAGKKGWAVDSLCARIAGHNELGRHLRWYDKATDSFLGELYRNALCVLSPSLGEGFGLSVVEGRLYNKPLLLRDLPVYREVAGAGATYFSGETASDLAEAVETWLLRQAASDPQPAVSGQPQSWQDSCNQLWAILNGQDRNDSRHGLL